MASSLALISRQSTLFLTPRSFFRSIRIYTKTGDKGKTSNYAGERLPKDGPTFEALGCTDELSSAIGHAREHCLEAGHGFHDQLQTIQCDLQDVGSNIATPRQTASEDRLVRTAFPEERVKQLEKWIDEMDEVLPPLKNFILPSGGKAATALHMSRSICRRAERRVVPLVREETVDRDIQIYLNRLSDYLFTLARRSAQLEGKEESIYKRPS
ncbi:corrinoid adenosyltransferase MMAB-like isoform X2 [Sycon ciliatum]|uniref:corrinoid adenosyltransferase MMAB-like isoform X2 n=1 Tax=Sycon ciliatum TaxID=27933 RepID=UPI0020AED446|eukprot:scpid75479/ scgid3962/ Cob(I)yrinic acid a,c-diamide adenosyltransferase, mitochondrial; Cob(I)alamin adenosyltransferase; Methylmalonic aciduria type B homolog